MADNEDITDEPGRRRDDDDYSDDRPRRRRRRDDSGDDPYESDRDRDRFRRRSWLEKELLNTNIVVIVFFALCCNGCFMLPLVFGIVGTVTCKDPEAQQKARILLIISSIVTVLSIVAQLVRFAIKLK
jgi:hypothetical protein